MCDQVFIVEERGGYFCSKAFRSFISRDRLHMERWGLLATVRLLILHALTEARLR